MADLVYPITDFPNDAFEPYPFLVSYQALKLPPVLQASAVVPNPPNPDNVVLTFDVAPSVGEEALIDALVASHAGLPYPFGDWQSMYALDFRNQPTQALVGDTLTIGGVTFRARNTAQAGIFALTNGLGLVIDTAGGGGAATIELFQSTTNGPRLEVNLEDLYAEDFGDDVRLVIDAAVAFTDAAQFSFAGIVGTVVDTSGSALGSASTFHGQALRGNNSSNQQEVRGRANDASSGGERSAFEAGITDRSPCSLMLEWNRNGAMAAYIGGGRTNGYWPTNWRVISVGRPSLNSNAGHVQSIPGALTTLKRRAAFYVGRAGSTSEQSRIEVRYFEIFARRNNVSI